MASIPLKAISRHTIGGQFETRTYHLLLTADGKPISLGSGRYATVFLGSVGDDIANAEEFFAIKFLKRDPDSKIFNKIGLERFFEEVNVTRKFDLKTGFLVRYVAYGAVKKLGDNDPNDTKFNSQQKLYDALGRPQLNVLIGDNIQAGATLENLTQSLLQGPFMVLEAEYGTLEDLLVHRYPFDEHPLIRHSISQRNALQKLRDNCTKDRGLPDLLQELGIKDALKESKDFSGLSIIRAIDSKNCYSANSIIIATFAWVVTALKDLHSHEEVATTVGEKTRRAFAHRDLKPGNLLVHAGLPHPSFRLYLTDLGFVATADEVQSGFRSMAGNPREPGALALGTYLYRSPEQVESGSEVMFELVAGEPNVIRFRAMGDIQVWVNDWFESIELELDPPDPAKQGKPVKLAVKGWLRKDEENFLYVRLESNVKAKGPPKLYYHGYFTRLAGVHSDLFSLGALLYVLASGGKSPESFFSRCLHPVPDGTETARLGDVDIYDSCLLLTLALCSHHEAIRDFDAIVSAEDQNGLRNFVSHIAKPPSVLVTKFKLWPFRAQEQKKWESSEHENEYDFVHNLRRTPAVKYYLKNTNGNPISFAILYLIVRLMLRDRKQSFVPPVAEVTAKTPELVPEPGGRRWQTTGEEYWCDNMRELVEKVESEVATLSKAPSCIYTGRFARISKQDEAWLLALRFCLNEAMVTT